MEREYLEKIAVKSAPVYKLAEYLALEAGNDSEINPEETEEIKEEFRKHIYFFTEAQMKFIDGLIEKTRNGGMILNDDEIDLEGFYPYEYLSVFLHEDKLYLGLPDELRDIYTEAIAEENFEVTRVNNREMIKYATALINLYGIYEIQQFVSVWNQHHKEKINHDEAKSFLNASSDFAADYFADHNYVYSDSFFGDEEIKEFLEEVKDFKYYMPPKSKINLYSDENYYEKIPEYTEMADFLNQYVPNDNFSGDSMRLDILLRCKRLEKPIDIVNTLNQYDFPVEDKEAMKEFERLYKNMFNNTHMWELRGFTPPQFERESGKKLHPFKIPDFVRVEKEKRKNKKRSK